MKAQVSERPHMKPITRCYCHRQLQKSTYARVGLSETLDDADVEALDSGSADLLMVLIEPEVVGSVGTQVLLVAVEVRVPTRHFINNYNY